MSKYDASASDKILPPKGLHTARVVRFLELGTQATDYGDKFQVMISLELVDESAVFNEDNGEQNFVMHRTFNRSLKPRSDMGKLVRAVMGDELDEEIEMDDILDGACQVKVKYSKDGKYANMVSFEEPPKGKVSKSESELVSLYLDENFDQEVFDSLPDWIQEKIADSDEFKALVEDGTAVDPEEDKPKKKKGRKGDDDDDDDEDEPKRGKKSTKRNRKDDDEDDEDDEDDKPRRKGRKDDDDEEEDEDDKPRQNSRKNAGSKRPAKKARAGRNVKTAKRKK